jgi:HPt (histidine-containing phosphotransfer) domain-containing protein
MLGSDDPASLQDMLSMYWESEAGTPDGLKALAESRDGQGLKAAAHGAKGAAASIAAVHLADLCRALEHNAANEDWIAVDRLTAQIDQAFKDVGVFIANTRENAAAV